MSDNRVNIQYTVQEVTSAQRMRLMRSGQLKMIVLFWAGSVIFFGLHVLFPQSFRVVSGVTWTLIGQVSLAYFVSLLAIFVILPWVSFHLTRFWKLPLVFQFGQKDLRLSVAGKRGGLRLGWDQVRRVDENDLVFVIYYDDGQKHFIVPKAGFSEGAEARFRRQADRHLNPAAGLPAAAQQPAAGRTQPAAERTQPDDDDLSPEDESPEEEAAS
jgi:hypothetical protein